MWLGGVDDELKSAQQRCQANKDAIDALHSAHSMSQLEKAIWHATGFKFNSTENPCLQNKVKNRSKKTHVSIPGLKPLDVEVQTAQSQLEKAKKHWAALQAAETIICLEEELVTVNASECVDLLGDEIQKRQEELNKKKVLLTAAQSAHCLADLTPILKDAQKLKGLDREMSEIKAALEKKSSALKKRKEIEESLQVAESIPELEESISIALEQGVDKEKFAAAQERLESKKNTVAMLQKAESENELDVALGEAKKFKVEKDEAYRSAWDKRNAMKTKAATAKKKGILAKLRTVTLLGIPQLEAELKTATALVALTSEERQEIDDAGSQLRRKKDCRDKLQKAQKVDDLERHLVEAKRLGGLEEEMKVTQQIMDKKRAIAAELCSVHVISDLQHKIEVAKKQKVNSVAKSKDIYIAETI